MAAKNFNIVIGARNFAHLRIRRCTEANQYEQHKNYFLHILMFLKVTN